jgi:hypothetical protein
MGEVALRGLAFLLLISFLGCATKAQRRTPSWPVVGKRVYVSEMLVPFSKLGLPDAQGLHSGSVDEFPIETIRPLASYPPCEALEVLKVGDGHLRLWHLEDAQIFELRGNWERLVHETKEECLSSVEPEPSQEGEVD